MLAFQSRIAPSAFLTLCICIAPPLAGDDRFSWLVIQPGYPGTTAGAGSFMRSFSRYIEKETGLRCLESTYYNLPSKALVAISERRPSFVFVSLGFYLKNRCRFGMTALLESTPPDRFLVVGRAGGATEISQLGGGNIVAGGPLYEPDFLQRVVFPAETPFSRWKLQPTLRTSRAIRRLTRGRYQAVVLTGREYDAVSRLSAGKKLEKMFESDYYPATLVVALENPPEEREAKVEARNGGPAKGDATGREQSGSESSGEENSEHGKPKGSKVLSVDEKRILVDALTGMAKGPDGRDLLKRMGVQGFRPVRPGWLKKMEGEYDAFEKK